MMYYGYGAHLGGFDILFTILWWVFIIILIGAVVRSLRRDGYWRHGNRNSALEILKERYAKGEIDKAEFEAKKKDLE